MRLTLLYNVTGLDLRNVGSEESFPSTSAVGPHIFSGLNTPQKRFYKSMIYNSSSQATGLTPHTRIHDPQELFMTEICDTLELRLIVGKVNARRWDRPLSESERRHLDPLDFFYRSVPTSIHVVFRRLYALLYISFTYNQKTGSFTSMEQVEIPLNELRGNSCDICLKASELDTRDHAQLLGVHGSVAGVALRGTNYHINDFAMVRSDSGACIIGQLLDIKEVSRRGPLTATIQVLGRMNELLSKYPHKFLKDEVSSSWLRRQ